jgi:hypothetical protein
MNDKEFSERVKKFDRAVIGYLVSITVSLITALIVCKLFN